MCLEYYWLSAYTIVIAPTVRRWRINSVSPSGECGGRRGKGGGGWGEGGGGKVEGGGGRVEGGVRVTINVGINLV